MRVAALIFALLSLIVGCQRSEPREAVRGRAGRLISVKVQTQSPEPTEVEDVGCQAELLMSLRLTERDAFLDGWQVVDDASLRDTLRKKRQLDADLGWEGSAPRQTLTIFVQAGVLNRRLRRFMAVARGAGYEPEVVVQSPTR